MFELISSGGWLMAPIILCSVISVAIIIERLWTLKKESVAPSDLVIDIEYLLAVSYTHLTLPTKA